MGAKKVVELNDMGYACEVLQVEGLILLLTSFLDDPKDILTIGAFESRPKCVCAL